MTAPASALPGAAELRNANASVRVMVAPGAPITSFITAGVDWCDAGAITDYAPTLGACVLPTFISGVPRAAFPQGGLLAAEEPVVEVRANGVSGTISTTWSAATYPLAWHRLIELDPDGALVAHYTVTNQHRARLPFVWGVQVRLPWSSSVELGLPRGSRARVAQSIGEGLAKPGSEFTWPALRDGGRLADLQRPISLDSRRAALCYIETPRGKIVLHRGASALEVSGDADVVTHAHVWVDNDAESSGAVPRRWWRRHTVRRELAAGVSVGAPGELSEAVGAWRAARWLDVGQTLQWTIRYRPLPTTI